jgi:hypothetical protein
MSEPKEFELNDEGDVITLNEGRAGPRGVSDLTLDHDDSCLDFVFNGKKLWTRLQIRQTGRKGRWETFVDNHIIQDEIMGVAPDLTCAEMIDIGITIGKWLEEPLWANYTITRSEFAAEVVMLRDRVREMDT